MLTDLEYKMSIIERSNIDDIRILDKNYSELVRNTVDVNEVRIFTLLHKHVQRRLKTLTERD